MSIPITLPATPETFVAYQEQLIHRKLTAAEREVTAEWLGIFNDVRTGELDGETASARINFLISRTADPGLLRFLTAAREWIVYLCYSKERGIYETTTKTGGPRYVNIPRETVALLRKYRASQVMLQLANGDRWQDTGYLFTQGDGRPMNPTSITAWLRKFSMRRGLPHINPHAFRHSVASILISAGTDIVTVSKQLGHAQVSTTGDIYSHVIEEAKAQATECIADIMLRRKQA